MRLAKIRSDFERRHCSRFGFWERILRPQITVPSQQHVAIGNAIVRESVAGILRDRLLKVSDRLVESFFRPAVPMNAALANGPGRLRPFPWALFGAVFFPRASAASAIYRISRS